MKLNLEINVKQNFKEFKISQRFKMLIIEACVRQKWIWAAKVVIKTAAEEEVINFEREMMQAVKIIKGVKQIIKISLFRVSFEIRVKIVLFIAKNVVIFVAGGLSNLIH